ncbi:MAG: 2-oxo acid dehydrogenase subunit E2 [Methanomassiliicoccaceae archaeon]|jgi:pyruvate/2-oxoglutarate dehydrogenase complex dihydrolipoamide acyltransferase (E2) component|nr:2-oxo acid dehydrogenase subunit E2 [Methanomassiliicoccaceae archaeon]
MVKRRRKDRRDGRYLYDADPMHKFMPYLMPKRTECEVFLRESIDVTNIMDYLEARKGTDGNNVTLFSVLISTIVRIFALRPNLNNFIAGHRLYRRHNVDVGFVVKKEFSDAGGETVARIAFDQSMTIFEISNRLYKHVSEVRASGSEGADSTIRTFTKLPRPVTKFSIAFLRFLNYYGKVPKSLTESDPNFASVFIANMGSIGGNAPFHHLNNWGTGSLFITVGAVQEKVIAVDGTIAIRKCLDLAFTVDERIADGYYFMRSIRMMKDILSDPSVLETPFSPEVST